MKSHNKIMVKMMEKERMKNFLFIETVAVFQKHQKSLKNCICLNSRTWQAGQVLEKYYNCFHYSSKHKLSEL